LELGGWNVKELEIKKYLMRGEEKLNARKDRKEHECEPT